jgi:hypothetical protein
VWRLKQVVVCSLCCVRSWASSSPCYAPASEPRELWGGIRITIRSDQRITEH